MGLVVKISRSCEPQAGSIVDGLCCSCQPTFVVFGTRNVTKETGQTL